MICNINSTRGQTRFLACVARVTCIVVVIRVMVILTVRVNTTQNPDHNSCPRLPKCDCWK